MVGLVVVSWGPVVVADVRMLASCAPPTMQARSPQAPALVSSWWSQCAMSAPAHWKASERAPVVASRRVLLVVEWGPVALGPGRGARSLRPFVGAAYRVRRRTGGASGGSGGWWSLE